MLNPSPQSPDIESIKKAIGISDDKVAAHLFEYFLGFANIVSAMRVSYNIHPNPDNITFDEYMDTHRCTCDDCSRLGSLLMETYSMVNEVLETLKMCDSMGIDVPADIIEDGYKLLYEVYKKDQDVNDKLTYEANLNLN